MLSRKSLGAHRVSENSTRKFVSPPDSFSRRALALCALAALATPAFADPVPPFRPDAAFNGGAYFVDAFSGSFDQNYRAKKLALLDNGDVIVAGLVPHLKGGNSGGLGLVRYDSAGQRVTWANPGDWGFDGNQYVVYDPNALTPHPIQDVKDLRVFGNYLFVLVDADEYRFDTQHFQSYFDGYASDVLVFTLDGQFVGDAEIAFNSANAGDPRNFLGGGIAVFSNGFTFPGTTSLVFGGTSVEAGVARPVFRRYSVASDGSLSADFALMYPNPGNYCPNYRGCTITSVAVGGRSTATSPPRIYLGGARLHDLGTSNWNFMVMSLSTDGSPNTSFNQAGIQDAGFDLNGSDDNDAVTAMAVVPAGVQVGASNLNQEQVYLVGNVAVPCHVATGIVKLLGDGTFDDGFGFSGLEYDQANYVAPGTDCQSLASVSDLFPNAAGYMNGTLAIVGYRNTRSALTASEPADDAEVTFLDAASGGIVSYNIYPYPNADGRTRHSGLWGVAMNDNVTLTAVGDVRYTDTAAASLQGKMQYATLRITDHIFRDRFGGPAGQ